jgi:cell wall assembly regulator SMI1
MDVSLEEWVDTSNPDQLCFPEAPGAVWKIAIWEREFGGYLPRADQPQ